MKNEDDRKVVSKLANDDDVQTLANIYTGIANNNL